MSPAAELKLIFAGPLGAGKTTAINAISTRSPVSTEVASHDRARPDKQTTTVGLDYGKIDLEDGMPLHLYGVPGQERFSFMWEIVGRGALGIVLLLDASSPTVMQDFRFHLASFGAIAPGQPLVVGVGRSKTIDDPCVEACQRVLAEKRSVEPVFSVDVRIRADVVLLIEALLAMLELHTAVPAHGHA
jgi:signal recognition particle receptor subunit beta